MTKIAQTTVSKALVAFVAAAMLFTMFAAPVKAQTSVEDLQEMINDLMAQIAALSGTTGTTVGGNCAAIPAPLTIGAQNANVTALQNYLLAAGQSIPAGATGYFGTQTQSALAAWQAANGVSPAVGYYGPITASAMAAKCVPADEDEDEDESNGDLSGGEGDITVDTSIDGDISIDLGKADVALEFDIEAIDSDVELNRVDFFFSSSTDSDVLMRPWLYFDEVNLLIDGEEVASFTDEDDFTEVSGEYRARFSGIDVVIDEDETVTMALELVVLESMAGNRDADTINVAMEDDSIRFVDAAGLSETGGEDADADVDFEETFGEGDVSVSVAEDSPENATLVLDESSRTKATVLNFEVEAEESDIELNTVVLTLAATDDTVGNTVYRARLMDGNDELSSKTGSTTITFDDLDYMIDEDDEVEFTVELEFNDGEDVDATAFTVVSVEVIAENSDFETVDDSTGVNETHTIISTGIVADEADITVTKNDNVTTVTYEMDVTAYGEDFWISGTTTTAFDDDFTLPASTTVTISPNISVSGVSINSDGNYRIAEDTTRTVTVTYLFTNNGNEPKFVTGELASLDYGVAEDDATSKTAITLGAPDFDLPSNVSVNAPSN